MERKFFPPPKIASSYDLAPPYASRSVRFPYDMIVCLCGGHNGPLFCVLFYFDGLASSHNALCHLFSILPCSPFSSFSSCIKWNL